MAFQTLYFLADLFWVGRLGKEAVAGVGDRAVVAPERELLEDRGIYDRSNRRARRIDCRPLRDHANLRQLEHLRREL
jgi:hypothetical protein